jgi:hypothetical protein
MAKVIAVIADEQPTTDNKISLTVCVVVVPEGAETFAGKRLDSSVIITGQENATQINSAIDLQVKADVLARMGLTVTSADIKSTKFS